MPWILKKLRIRTSNLKQYKRSFLPPHSGSAHPRAGPKRGLESAIPCVLLIKRISLYAVLKDLYILNSRILKPAIHLMPTEETEMSPHSGGKLSGLVFLKDRTTASNMALS